MKLAHYFLFAALMALPFGSALVLGFPIALVVYLLISLVTYGLYRYDKRQARQGRWRIPEKILHAAAFYGGWPGALIAQQRLRHKTRKLRFLMPFWGIVLLHQLFWVYWLLPGEYRFLDGLGGLL
ncbi:MAG TPA: DUF1294 domain-containing protein [Pseudomonas sp.]|nr:DUF1294 domain-containing protein [Pseudomonas sp.]